MKIIDKVKEIIESYGLKPIKLPDGYKNIYDLIKDIPEVNSEFDPIKDDLYFIKKYKDNIGEGHYGFSLGNPTPPEWCEIIDQILEYCLSVDPDFEIHQIKIKFGFLCFYVKSDAIEDIQEVEVYLMKILNDKALIF